MSWDSQMDTHCKAFRDKWQEDGFSYLVIDPIGSQRVQGGSPETRWQEVDQEIVELFEKFKAGKSSPAQHSLTTMAEARATLGEDLHEDLDTLVNSYLDDWDGDGADNFRTYLGSMKDALRQLQDAIAAANEATRAYRELLKGYHEDILNLVEQTQAGIDKAEADAEEESQKQALNAVATVVAVGAAIATAGTAAVAMAGVAGALTAGGATHMNLEISGKRPAEIIMSMLDEGDKVVDEAHEAGSRVRNAFFAVTESVTDVHPNPKKRRLEQVRPERPDIVTDKKFNPDDFHHEDQSPGANDRVDRGEVVEEPHHEDHRNDYGISNPENPDWNQKPLPDDQGLDNPPGLPAIVPTEPTDRDLYHEQ